MTNKSNKKERDDIISAENRIITRTPTYETNQKKKQQIKKFIASDNKPIQIKREKGNNLKVYCSTVAFEAVREIPKRKKYWTQTIQQIKHKLKAEQARQLVK